MIYFDYIIMSNRMQPVFMERLTVLRIQSPHPGNILRDIYPIGRLGDHNDLFLFPSHAKLHKTQSKITFLIYDIHDIKLHNVTMHCTIWMESVLHIVREDRSQLWTIAFTQWSPLTYSVSDNMTRDTQLILPTTLLAFSTLSSQT